ncbi:MAG: hypothetical protein U1C74_15690 [Phenylobacterium sp.]|jgi:hypothetical protein|uniref:Lysozyme n=1 Tax=Brevundimonas mediterranea TaxID=74329 RepID=A0AB37E478_9CAUL|nr:MULTISPECIES: hypothetical protein [Brevundimonas]MDZ4372850.1 hypothetical protein [Phenylobacterium sp.]OYX79878.1 MAG: hypothetical protein B7Y85_07340 [Brevundimonas sp. 32-68-21]MBA4333249.1 hypothetical protein [Brevundimonas sp.]QIH71992.1 hypothetical protein GYM46_02810 [Brevundimonas mediterranea]TAJ43509.1 MAG: hypothetical protein EPO54_07665 [Brevundimonas sp.]
MRAVSILKALTPLGWLAVAGVVAGLAAALLGGLGFRWDPLGLQQRRLAAAEARAASGERDARAQTAARRLESEGADEQLRRLDDFQQQQTAAARATATAVAQARNADDAEIPLESRRADRLRAHDRELCALATDLDGCAGAAQPAGGGEAAVRPGGFAG